MYDVSCLSGATRAAGCGASIGSWQHERSECGEHSRVHRDQLKGSCDDENPVLSPVSSAVTREARLINWTQGRDQQLRDVGVEGLEGSAT